MLLITKNVIRFFLITFWLTMSWSCQNDDPQPSNGNVAINPNTPNPDDSTLYDLQITITGFENTNGQIVLALFDSQNGFEKDIPVIGRFEPLTAMTHSLIIEDLLTGFYGISCYHDENEDGELDTNFFGIPQEGFGFSTNPLVTSSAPEWSEIRFFLIAEDSIQTIELKYF